MSDMSIIVLTVMFVVISILLAISLFIYALEVRNKHPSQEIIIGLTFIPIPIVAIPFLFLFGILGKEYAIVTVLFLIGGLTLIFLPIAGIFLFLDGVGKAKFG